MEKSYLNCKHLESQDSPCPHRDDPAFMAVRGILLPNGKCSVGPEFEEVDRICSECDKFEPESAPRVI